MSEGGGGGLVRVSESSELGEGGDDKEYLNSFQFLHKHSRELFCLKHSQQAEYTNTHCYSRHTSLSLAISFLYS